MIVFPAIDIQDGRCVRLVRGDFSTLHQVADDPLKTANRFLQAGAVWLHMVDLDGAVQGRPVNAPVFTQIAAQCGLKLQLGGGIRDMESIEFYLARGVQRVVLGSAALFDPALVAQAARLYGARIAVGIDARDRLAAAQGWLSTSDTDYIELAKRMEQLGVKVVIFTDISRDGTLSGPPLQRLSELKAAVGCRVIASGGVSSQADIAALQDAGMYGAICGKSLYAQTLDLAKAIETAGDQNVD